MLKKVASELTPLSGGRGCWRRPDRTESIFSPQESLIKAIGHGRSYSKNAGSFVQKLDVAGISSCHEHRGVDDLAKACLEILSVPGTLPATLREARNGYQVRHGSAF